MEKDSLRRINGFAKDIYDVGYNDGFRARQASRSYSQDLADCDDNTREQYAKQRAERGFDDSELWCFSQTVSRFLVDRLKALKELDHGCPRGMKREEYDEDIDAMIKGFEYASHDMTDLCGEYETCKQHAIEDAMNKAVDLLHKHYFHLYGFERD